MAAATSPARREFGCGPENKKRQQRVEKPVSVLVGQHVVEKGLGDQRHAEIDEGQEKTDAKDEGKGSPIFQDAGKKRPPDTFRFAFLNEAFVGTQYQHDPGKAPFKFLP